MYTVKDPELDLRKLLVDDGPDVDVKELVAQIEKDKTDGNWKPNYVTESLDERIDRWIFNHEFPSMTPAIAKKYRARLKELQKEGKI